MKFVGQYNTANTAGKGVPYSKQGFGEKYPSYWFSFEVSKSSFWHLKIPHYFKPVSIISIKE